jgi:hypothetical protein
MASYGQAARELRERVRSAPGHTLQLKRDEIVSLLGTGIYSGSNGDSSDAARFAQATLTQHGLRVQPRLTDNAPGGAVSLRADNVLALQASASLTLVAAVVGLYGYWLYGLLMAIAGSIAVSVLTWRWEALDRGAPRWLPRGRAIGVAVTAPLLAVAVIGGVLPIRQHRKHTANSGTAAALVRQADAAIDAGDLDTAKTRLFQAEAIGHLPASIDDVRAHLIVAEVQLELNDFARKEGIFDEAERAYISGQRNRAIRLMRSIRGFRNADARLRAYLARTR